MQRCADQHEVDRVDSVSAVFQLAREMRRQIGELMAGEKWALDTGFRPPCLGVLAVVDRAGPVSQRAIADTLGLDASDVVGVLDILEGAHLIERRRDPQDRRRHAVVLTPAGRRAARRSTEVRALAEQRVLANLAPDERAQLADLLSRALG